jgi:hypothetical protein
MSYLYVKWNSFELRFARRGIQASEGGAFRPQWRSGQGRIIG